MLRRDALRLVGLGAMSIPRRPDQRQDPPTAVVAPGSQTGIFRGRLVVISGSGPGSGLFVYAPSLGANNLVASIAANVGVDRFGNQFLAGMTTYQELSDSKFYAVNFQGTGGSGLQFYVNTGPGMSGGWLTNAAWSLLQIPGFKGWGFAGPGNMITVVPSGDATGVTDAANINLAFTLSNTVLLVPGSYSIGSTVTLAAQQFLKGAGRWATLVNFTGTGDCIRQQNTLGSGSGLWGGGVLDLTIDGTSAGAGSTGLHMGDGEQFELNVAVQNFSGAGSIGYHFDNNIWFTEKIHGTIWARNCTQHVVFDVTGTTSASSFGYLDLTCYIQCLAGQNGVVLQNGARPYHGRLIIKGNFAGTNANAILTLTGVMPHAPSTASALIRCQVDIQAEGNPSTIRTINFGATTNQFFGCYGIMDFTQGATLTPSNITSSGSANVFGYTGLVLGDVNLQPSGTVPVAGVTGMAMSYGQSFMGTNGNTFVNDGDFFKVTLTANMTVNLTPGGVSTAVCPQRKTIIIQQAAAVGMFTVTWPNPGAPTNAAPAVKWAGGVAPVMTGAVNAVDVYDLRTIDGAIWYGSAVQNVS